MALDHYSLCPCGSGKKIKFCCSNDILPELEKVVRAIEGDQEAPPFPPPRADAGNGAGRDVAGRALGELWLRVTGHRVALPA